MAKKRAAAVVADWVRDSEQISEAVVKQSLQELIRDVQTPTAKGGRMRVDTGFLRASGQGALGQMPTGPSRAPDERDVHYDDGKPVPTATIITLAKLKIGDTFYFGWTANYARYREAHDGFLRLGVQKWQTIVNGVVGRLSRKNKGE